MAKELISVDQEARMWVALPRQFILCAQLKSSTFKLGRPLETYDLGETEIDEATFWEYIDEMKSHYTAEKVRVHIESVSRRTTWNVNCDSFPWILVSPLRV